MFGRVRRKDDGYIRDADGGTAKKEVTGKE